MLNATKLDWFAQEFTQKYVTDSDETFCPVVMVESIRTLITLSVQYGLELHPAVENTRST